MQTILSVDVTTEPAQAVVVHIEGSKMEVVEHKSALLNDLFSKETLLQFEGPSAAPPADGAAAITPKLEAFRSLIHSVQSSWTGSILVVPQYESHSLNVELPFGDVRNVEKILDMEVQDVVPFDVSEFLLHHATVAAQPEGQFDIHVGLVPKKYVRALMAICQQSHFDPLIMSTVAGAIGAIYHLAPNYLVDNSAIVYARNGVQHIALAFDGAVKMDRVSETILRNGAAATQSPSQVALSDLKLTIASAEQRYGRPVKTIYLMGSGLEAREVQRTVGRNVESLNVGELIRTKNEESAIAGLASIFAQDIAPPPILVNYRAREFSYRPQLKELLAGLKNLAPYLVGTVAMLLISLGAVYFLREHHISTLQAGMAEQITRVIPNLALPPGDEVKGVRTEIGKLSGQLAELGSASAFSPLDTLLRLSQDIENTAGLDIRRIEIKGSRVIVEGNAPSYRSFDRIKNSFKRGEKSFYCHVRDETSNSGAKSVRFTLTIELCE